MATSVLSPPFFHPLHQLQFSKCPRLSSKSHFRPRLLRSISQRTIRAISAVAAESVNLTLSLFPFPPIIFELGTQQDHAIEADIFACPVCYEPLIRKGPSGLNLPAIYRSGFMCKRCKKTYSSKDRYLDLTVTAGLRDYTEIQPARTELFRSPLVSFLYERGWRQNFRQSGFPGPDEEFKMAQEYFESAEGGLLVDVSCGSGLFSRKFAKSGTYSGVIALDFSENMLRQCYDFIEKDNTLSTNNIALVRADVSRLPFSSGSVDAVHAGAALHCWPSPSNAVSAVSRTPQGYGYLTEEEIKDLCTSCGLTNYSSKIQQAFIMFTAQKP
ncbi:hypothetical protein JHK82_024515 [Glycine max]|nr:hypothetical protein JHK85_025113 [Glycine max]KAG5133327.1 hypothetical protein JHK82_024515 [Glycine max]